jgi:chromosome segregation ATPase
MELGIQPVFHKTAEEEMQMDIQTLKFKVISTAMGLGITKEASMEAFEAQARQMLPSFNKLEALQQELNDMLPEFEEKVKVVAEKKANLVQQINDLQKQIDELDILADDYIESLTALEARLSKLMEQDKKMDDLTSKMNERKNAHIAKKLVEYYDVLKYEAYPEAHTLTDTVREIVNNRNKESITQVLKSIKQDLFHYAAIFNKIAEEQGLYSVLKVDENPKFTDKNGYSHKFYFSAGLADIKILTV